MLWFQYWARERWSLKLISIKKTNKQPFYSGLIETYQAKLKEAEEKAVKLSSCLGEKDAEIEELKQKLSEQRLKFVGRVPFAADRWF